LAFPKVMSSYYFNDHDQGPPATPANARTCADGTTWVCEHRRPAIANMVAFRNAAGSQNISDVVVHGPNTVSFRRAGRAFIMINRDSALWTVAALPTGLPAGRYCNVVVSDDVQACPLVTVDSSGTVRGLVVEPLSAVALHVHAMTRNTTVAPTPAPTNATKVPTTRAPTNATKVPTTRAPTNATKVPTTRAPTNATKVPTTRAPTNATKVPTTRAPTNATKVPTTRAPTNATKVPTPVPTPDALAGACEAAMLWLLGGHCAANRAYYAARGLDDCTSKCATVRYLEAAERKCSQTQVHVACE